MKPVKRQVIDVNEGYRKNILGCFDDYRDFLLCINSLQDPSNRIQFSPYRTSFVTPGSIEERIYMRLFGILWETNR